MIDESNNNYFYDEYVKINIIKYHNMKNIKKVAVTYVLLMLSD